MTHLTQAHQQLFRRSEDETFSSLEELWQHCHRQKEASVDRWHRPQELLPTSDMTLCAGSDGAELKLNDWSFSQLCRLAGVSKETINRLSSKTASRALQETLRPADKPLQLLTTDETLRAIHGVTYTRLWNVELLSMLQEFATDFRPPQQAAGGGTGLYCGEQDLFCFLIDPTGWTEIAGEAFAPGFYVWNSEVGRRSLGVQAFWFQKICQNHIVWDAVDVVEFKRKHTAHVHDALTEIRQIIETLVARRDERRDGFAQVIQKAMQTRLGDDAHQAGQALAAHGITRGLAKQALELARRQGAFTIFSLVDALTRISQDVRYAGERVELDHKVARLLSLAA